MRASRMEGVEGVPKRALRARLAPFARAPILARARRDHACPVAAGAGASARANDAASSRPTSQRPFGGPRTPRPRPRTVPTEEKIMNKRFLIGLAPLVAVGALVAMPAASQAACTPPACPHGYENGVRTPEGKKVRGIAWGTGTLKNATLGVVECHNIAAGYEENPVGGGASKGKVQAYVPYECVSASCLALGGKSINVVIGKLPWRAEAIEPEAGVFRQRTGFKSGTTNKPPSE